MADNDKYEEGEEQVSSTAAMGADTEPEMPQDPEETKKRSCCSWWVFDNVDTARGYNLNGIARGAVVMSNIFLSTAFIYYASARAGCLDEEDEPVDDCENKVYGFAPGALVANIAVISGLLSAFLMPVIGAIVDYTKYRRTTGIAAAVLITVIQATQIALFENTWYPMLILQAIAGFLYQVLVLACYAYLPDMAYVVGEKTMTNHTATFVMTQFTAQFSFLILVVALSIVLDTASPATARMSQAINTVWIIIAFYYGWSYFPERPASHELPEGRSVFVQGFVQIWGTVRIINHKYANSLRWYLICIVFAEAAVNAFTTVSVVFLADQIGMNATEIGIFFIVVLISTLPGSKLSAYVTHRLNPNHCIKLSLAALIVVSYIGALILQKDFFLPACGWGIFVGICLGWFYPAENIFFSMCLPKGYEAEMSGFFVYSTQILGWLPPLVFSILVDNNIDQEYGVMAVAAFMIPAIGVLFLTPSWDKVLEEVGRSPHQDADAEGETENA